MEHSELSQFKQALFVISQVSDSHQRGQAQHFLDKLEQGKVISMCFQLIMDQNRQLQNMGYIYLKYILKETKHKFPDLSCYFQEAFQQENMNTEKQQKIGECFTIFMNKASHIAYKKEFIDSFAGNLVKDCSKNIVNVSQIKLCLYLIGDETQNKQIKSVSALSIRSLNLIVSKQSLKKPENVTQLFWMRLMLCISQYCGINAPIELIVKGFRQNVPLNIFIRTMKAFNKCYQKLIGLQDMFIILHSLKKKTQNYQIIEHIQLNHGTETNEVLIQCIRNILVLALQESESQLQKSDGNNINEVILASYFQDYTVWLHYMTFFTRTLSYYEQTAPFISDLITQVINAYLQHLSHIQISQFISSFIQVNTQYTYCLLSTMPRNIMNSFDSHSLIVSHVKLQKELSMSFLNFIVRFLKVHEYIEEQQSLQCINSICNHLINYPTANLELNEARAILKKKVIAYNIEIIKQKYHLTSTNQVQHKCANYFQYAISVLTQAIKINICDQQFLQTIVDSLSILSSYPNFQIHIYHQCCTQLKLLLTSFNLNDYIPITTFITRSITQVYQPSYPYEPCLNIINATLLTNHIVLCEQGCKLAEYMCVSMNKMYKKEPGEQQVIGGIFTKILFDTMLFKHIFDNLAKGNDAQIFTSILLEAVIHPSLSERIYREIRPVCQQQYIRQTEVCIDLLFSLFLILYNVRDDHTLHKGIEARYDEMKNGNIELLLQNMNFQEKRYYTESNSSIKWSCLPIVRKVLHPESILNYIIDPYLKN